MAVATSSVGRIRRRTKRVGIARLKNRNGVVFEFDLRPPRDSVYQAYDCDVTYVVVRRKGFLVKGHVLRTRLENGTLVYEGEVILFLSPFKKKEEVVSCRS